MKKSQVILGLFVLAVSAVLGWQVFGSRRVPLGQPPLADLGQSGIGQFEKSFDNAAQHVRVLALLSPT